jgi:hypothetical protein
MAPHPVEASASKGSALSCCTITFTPSPVCYASHLSINKYNVQAYITVINRRYRKTTYKHKDIMNDWNYNTSCKLTSLPFSNLENFKQFIFVVLCTNLTKLSSPLILTI